MPRGTPSLWHAAHRGRAPAWQRADPLEGGSGCTQLVAGLGGSALTAQHLAVEQMGPSDLERVAGLLECLRARVCRAPAASPGPRARPHGAAVQLRSDATGGQDLLHLTGDSVARTRSPVRTGPRSGRRPLGTGSVGPMPSSRSAVNGSKDPTASSSLPSARARRPQPAGIGRCRSMAQPSGQHAQLVAVQGHRVRPPVMASIRTAVHSRRMMLGEDCIARERSRPSSTSDLASAVSPTRRARAAGCCAGRTSSPRCRPPGAGQP